MRRTSFLPFLKFRHEYGESDRASKLQGSFGGWNSRIGEYLSSRFGQKLTRDSLLMLALTCSMLTELPLPRDYKRRKCLLLKWMDMNYDQCMQYLPYIEVSHTIDT